MRGGCIKNLLAGVGCLTVLVLLGLGAWQAREQVAGVYRSIVGDGGSPAAAEPTVGVPSEEALRAAERKEAEMERRGGPGYIVLTADEVASLIVRRLDPAVRAATDSVTVTLYEHRLVLEGQILLEVFGRDLLGPLADFLGSRQPLRIGGGLEVREPGIAAWKCDEFVIRSFPFPEAVIPRLVNRLSGDTAGAFLIPVPSTVGEVYVKPDGVTFYRRVN